MNQNNKKILAEKLKNHLNSLEYVAIPDLIKSGDYGPDLVLSRDKNICRFRRGINDLGDQHALISKNDLEPVDWEEITKLIKRKNEERENNYQAKIKEIEDKVNSQPGLFYYYGDQSRNKPGTPSLNYGDKEGAYFTIESIENNQVFTLNISNNHPVLDNFPFEKYGYYLIETDKPIERNDGIVRPWSDGGESNPSNFHKWVEVGDKITIIPYEVKNDSELPEKEIKDCDICQRNFDNTEKLYNIRRYHGQVGDIIQTCSNCYKNKEQEYLQNYECVFCYPVSNGKLFEKIKWGKDNCYAGEKDQNGKVLKQENCPHCQPWKKFENPNSNQLEKEVINRLIQYFQSHNIQKIELKEGKLIITNNNEVKDQVQINNDTELEDIQNWLQKKGQNTLTYQELNKLNNSPTSSHSPKTDYTPYLVGGIIGVLIILIAVISYCLGKRKNKKNIE